MASEAGGGQGPDFAAFWNLGYRRIVPVTPPDAQPHPQSALANRPKALGKAPGVRGDDALWRGLPWLKHETVEADLARWQVMGASVGLRTGAGLYAVDVDTLDEDLAERVDRTATEMLGPAKLREGRAPKFLLPYRCVEQAPYMCVKFKGAGGAEERVELLGEGRQFVAAGPHPSGVAYRWPEGAPSFDELALVTLEQFKAFFARLAEALPGGALDRMFAQSGNPPDQASLIGDPDTVRRAVEAMPNVGDRFATRAAYVQTGYAIKGATQDDEGLGLELFQDWCGRWTDGENDPDTVEADWRRMQPPFHSGAPQLYRMADEASGGRFKEASAYFSVVPPSTSTSPFDQATAASTGGAVPGQRRADGLKLNWRQPWEFEALEKPQRRWIVPGMIPDREVILLTGEGGVGKSLLAQQVATLIALGDPVFGRKIIGPMRVLMVMCEDSEDELHIRQKDIQAKLGGRVPADPMLRIVSRKGEDNLLSSWRQHESRMALTPFWTALATDVRDTEPKLLVLDTASDMFGGNENDRQQVRIFLQGCLGQIALRGNCAVMLLAHPSKSGGAKDGDGTSGSTAWHGTVRARWYLQKSGNKGGPNRRLRCMKMQYGADDAEIQLRYSKGQFDALSGDGGGPLEEGGQLEGIPTNEQAARDLILAALGVDKIKAMALQVVSSRARSYAPRELRDHFEPLARFEEDTIRAALDALMLAGVVREVDLPRTRNGTKSPKGLAIDPVQAFP